MSSYVFMKVLESAPWRYDRGIRLLTRGRIGEVYRFIADRVAAPGNSILEIGCGTGAVALACAERGAKVAAVDVDAGMLEVARAKATASPGGANVEWIELGAVEIEDRFAERSFDAVVSCLAFSELAPEEQDYVLAVACRLLKPGGRLVIADEVLPEGAMRRAWHRLVRWPLAALTYALSQTTTRPLAGLPERVARAGFSEVEEMRPWSADLAVVVARRPGGNGGRWP